VILSKATKDTEVLLGFDLGDEQVATLVARFPQVNFRYDPSLVREGVEAHLGNAEALFGNQIPRDLALCPHLRWIQLTGAGYDHLLQDGILESGVTVTNAPLFGIPIGEYVLSSMLALSRRFFAIAVDFHTKRQWPQSLWSTPMQSELFGRSVGIVGYGAIGQAVAKLALAFGMSVIATRQSVTRPTTVDGVRILPAAQLSELLGASDFVVLSLPLTPQSRNLIGREQLQQMKAGAYLINIARGALVDEAALIEALQNGHLGGAALDVFSEEPLPASSPLFDLPNVWLTPHIAGVTSAYHARMTSYFAENLERYLAGQTPLNVISRMDG
jgi:D-2-hydroxyacid dehydrogenase (NADP+)